MTYTDKDFRAAENIFRNAKVAILSIDEVQKDLTDDNLKAELTYEREGYESFLKEFSAFLKEQNYRVDDLPALKKAGMKMGIAMNTLTDKSSPHIANLMLKGTVTGISELIQLYSRDEREKISDDVIFYAKKLQNLEEEYEARLKKLL